jgi:cytochrome c oxidase subunit II
LQARGRSSSIAPLPTAARQHPVLVALVDTRKDFEDLSSTYLLVAIAVFAVVALALVVSLLRFRAGRRGSPSSRDEPAWLPFVYGGFLAAVIVVLLVLTFNVQDRISAKADPPGLRVDVTAAKWNWRFDYPAHGISQIGGDSRPTVLVVPSDTDVRFRMTSIDVIHSFWIPYVRFKRDAFPARYTEFDLSFGGTGYHTAGRCAEFCGLKHDQMTFNVDVMSPADFRAWVARKRSETP